MKKSQKKVILVPIGLLIIILFTITIYYYHSMRVIQKDFAEKNFQKYIAEQHISLDNIQSKTVIWDYKKGEYIIRVIYKDDNLNIYEYMCNPKRTQQRYNTALIVSKTSDNSSSDNFKYPPLE